jgi:hypothetical protein
MSQALKRLTNCGTSSQQPRVESREERERNDGRNRDNRKKVCHYCKMSGHFIRNCLKKMNDEKTGVSNASRSDEARGVETKNFVSVIGNANLKPSLHQYIAVDVLTPKRTYSHRHKRLTVDRRVQPVKERFLCDTEVDFNIAPVFWKKYCVDLRPNEVAFHTASGLKLQVQ